MKRLSVDSEQLVCLVLISNFDGMCVDEVPTAD